MPIKVELHSHTSDDPFDVIPYSTRDLIDRAARLGYGALAITLHDKQLDVAPFREYASKRGIVLIPGIERTIQGKHVLLINFANGGANVTSFDQLADLKRHDRGLVIAPHPFYPWPACMGSMMDRHAALVDAVEIHGMYAPGAISTRPQCVGRQTREACCGQRRRPSAVTARDDLFPRRG